MHYGSMHAHIEDFFMLGAGAKCNESLKNYCIFFVFGVLWGCRRTHAPAAYSHDSLAKQWPRYCEPPGSKPCLCAILAPFYEGLIPITVSYDLRT